MRHKIYKIFFEKNNCQKKGKNLQANAITFYYTHGTYNKMIKHGCIEEVL